MRTLIFCILAATGTASATAVAATGPLDIIIGNGLVYDGSGAKPVKADVGIAAGKIVFVGAAGQRTAKAFIDAAGLAVAPGFIDPHNHVAEEVGRNPEPFLDEQYLTQGVTTLLLGPDGAFSPAELRALIADLQKDGASNNYACYVGHNGVRSQVMKKVQRAPTAAELDQMKALVREGMQMGCVGFSSGLMYEPGMFSKTDELIELAREVAPFGGIYESHTRDPVKHMLASDTEAVDIGVAAGIPARVGHLKAVGLENKGRIIDVIRMIEAQRAAGHEITSDQYPYDGAATTPLPGVFVLPAGSPAPTSEWGWSAAAVRDALQAAGKDPGKRAALKAATENGIDGGFSWVKAVGYGSMRIVDAPGRPELNGKNLMLMARDSGRDPFDVLTELFLLDQGERIVITLGSIEEADVQLLMKQPWNMISSDGGLVHGTGQSGHPRSTGSFTRVLGHYSRDLKLFPLEEAIRKMTSLPADSLRLYDRGRIKAGLTADITVFDPRTVIDRSDYLHPNRLSEGVKTVLVNGSVVLRDGKVTGATPGRFVPRQARPAPESK